MKLSKNTILIAIFAIITGLQIFIFNYQEQKKLSDIKRESMLKRRFDDDDFKRATLLLSSLVEPIKKVKQPKNLKLIEEGFVEDWMWFKRDSLYFYYDMDGDIGNIAIEDINSITAELKRFYSNVGSPNEPNGLDIKINGESIGLDFDIGMSEGITPRHKKEVFRFVKEAMEYVNYKKSLLVN